MNQKECRYLTFPMFILKNGINDIKGCLDDAICYCFYDRYTRTQGAPEQRKEQIQKDLGINFSDPKGDYARGKRLHDSMEAKSPKTSISVVMVADYRSNYKTEFEIVTFLAFAGLRSIIQRQAYTKIPNAYFLSRMAGNNKTTDPLPEWVKPYCSRYQLDKIKTELQLNWGLKLYGNHTRGFYISFSLSIKELIYQAELRRRKYNENKLKDEKEQARKMILQTINGR